jgi:hypothetical protein
MGGLTGNATVPFAVLFGYFQADEHDPGPNLPGQMVFTCLSHDIVAHETMHAIVHRLRPGFNEVTNDDVLAFHEAFADLAAIFRHFTIEQVLVDAIYEHKADVTNAEAISSLARQFGFATAQKAPLRSALDSKPDSTALGRTMEPHARGVILVQAVFDAYRTTYLARVQDLLRLASGGSGILQEGRPHPDLVGRLAREASLTAQRFFDRCVQAFAYLPPIDVTFGDFLRALVTVDTVASPDDDGFRTAIIEAFRRRGIYASEAGSLAAAAVAWPSNESAGFPSFPPLPREVSELFVGTAQALGSYVTASPSWQKQQGLIASKLTAWARANALLLGLEQHDLKDRPIAVEGFHSTMRIDLAGQPWVDTVVQIVQRRRDLALSEIHVLDGVVPRAGATVVADAGGNVRYVMSKPLDHGQRLQQLLEVVDRYDRQDQRAAYRANAQGRLSIDFARLHGSYDRREA